MLQTSVTCSLRSQAERALNMLDDLRMCGLYPTDFTYNAPTLT